MNTQDIEKEPDPNADERALALILLLRYALARDNKRTFKTQQEFAKKGLKVAPSALTGALARSNEGVRDRDGSKQQRLDFERKCRVFFDGYFSNDPSIPDYIKEARDIAFARKPSRSADAAAFFEQAINSVAEVFARYNLADHRTKTTKLSERLGGRIYRVLRWAGPTNDRKPRALSEPRAVKASMKFLHPTRRGGFIRFHLHYRPHLVGTEKWEANSPSFAEGVVVPIEDHILMVGFERASKFPLIILAKFSHDAPRQFGGLVIRRADTKPQIFSSRVFFQRDEESSGEDAAELIARGKGPVLSDLDGTIGIYWEEELTPQEKAILDQFINLEDQFDGKVALTLVDP